MTKIYLETQGCSHNFADSEQMAGLLKQAKFEIIDEIEEADVVIINTCTVKTKTENSFYRRLKEIKEQYPYKIVVVAGCIAQTDPKKVKQYSLVGTKQIHNIVEVVEEALNDNVIQMLDTGEMPPLDLPRVRKNPIVEIIPISRGCLGACTFCKTKAARGNLQSYSIEEIKNEFLLALRDDVKEIWLTSQDTGCYGFDINTNLVHLLKELIALPGQFKIRIGMMNPNHLLKFKEEFLEIMKSNKIFKFLHLPLQSGSNEVLKSMNRMYSVEEYKQLVKDIKLKYPRMTIATDVIIGFPGETEEQNWETLNTIRELSFDVINISKFWARPKTKAAKMKQLPSEVIKHRSKIVTDICQNIFRLQNERWMDWEGEILIDEKGKEENQWVGRNNSYKPTLITGDYKLGQVLIIKVKKTSTYDLRGEELN
jgi:threonylcarbamoyladenosine tRNA methylthiotransferase CDKAL1